MADDLDADIRALYAADPASFVAERTAVAKRLRDEGRRDDASTVKGLRKPDKTASALDRAAAADPDALAALVKAAVAAGKAQESGGDMRAATAGLRDAVRTLASATADPAAATGALIAVVADPEALDTLAAGRLVSVPEGGGFGPLPLREAAPAPAPDRAAEDRARKAAEKAVAAAEAARDKAAAAHTNALERRKAAEADEQAAAEQLEAAEAELAALLRG